MQIIHIALGKANPERMNGVNKVVHQLASTQKSLGYDVTVWGIANDLVPTYPKRNFSTVLFQQQKNKGLAPKLKTALYQLPTTARVHIHGAFIVEFYQITRILKKNKVPYIFTPHGSFVEAAMKKNKWVKKIYFQLFEKQLIKDAKAIQLLGINEYTQLDQLVQVSHKQLIPNGIDTHKIPNVKSVQQEELVFGFCGRVDIHHKGLDLMVKGFQLFLENGGKGRLELIGDGDDKPKLEQLADQLGIAEKVVFHGALYGVKKFQTMKNFNVFLHTSRMEGFPMAVLEAAALSIPCITSEATNINAFIKKFDAGFTLLNNTPSDIAQTMEKCAEAFNKQTLKRLGENGRKMVTNAFDWNNIAIDLVTTYAA